MKNEYEAKFLNIEKNKLISRLRELKAIQIHPDFFSKRVIFESEVLNRARSWLRIREEYSGTKVTLKKNLATNDINTTKELEVGVEDLSRMKEIFLHLGLSLARYQESRREKWKLGDVIIDIDTWPKIPTLVEIEGPNEKTVRAAVEKIGFNYEEAKFGSIDEIYLGEYNIDILKIKNLTF